MRVAFVAPGFSTERSERQPWVYVDRIAAGLADQGFEISIITDQHVGIEPADTAPFEIISGQHMTGIRSLLRGRRLAQELPIVGKVDVLVSCVGWMDFAFHQRALAPNLTEIAVITSPLFARSEWPNLALSQSGQWARQAHLFLSQLSSFTLNARQFSRFDGVVVTSPLAYSHLSGRVGDLPILRAPSGVDPDVVRFAREREREIKTDGGRPVITYCGPMWKEKGFDTFIELIWHVNRTRAGVEFQVLLRPDSPAESEEARRFVERGRTFLSRNRVHVETRKLPRNEFLRALCASTVVVFPLQYSISMTPVSLLEALALGIPIVTTPVGELNGVVEGPACAVSHDYSAARIATALFNLLETLTVNGSHRSLEAEPPRMWGTSVRDWVEFIQDSEPCVS